SQPSENADVFRQFLIRTDAEAIFQSANPPCSRHIRFFSRLLGQANGVLIISHVGAVLVAPKAYGAVMLVRLSPHLKFEHVAAVAQQPAVKTKTVGNTGHGRAAIAQ